MLNAERRHMIKDLHKGLSISDAARASGHDRKTVRKVIPVSLLPMPEPRQERGVRVALAS